MYVCLDVHACVRVCVSVCVCVCVCVCSACYPTRSRPIWLMVCTELVGIKMKSRGPVVGKNVAIKEIGSLPYLCQP